MNKNIISIQYHKTKIGELLLGSYDDKLCLLDYRYRKMRATIDKRLQTALNAVYAEQESDITKLAKQQIDEYLDGKRKEFDIPILTVGTEFQKKVWEALMNTKYGATSSYLDIAKQIKNETAVRAVATANGANCINLIIPCHRIIGSDGQLTGYGGSLPVKQKLLNLENAQVPLFN